MKPSENSLAHYREKGWARFPVDPILQDWVTQSLAKINEAIEASENAVWRRYQETWFAGVNVLENDHAGAIQEGPTLDGQAVAFARSNSPRIEAWDRAQVSVCYPGYPKPMAGETEGQHRFRLNRDAAHVDGLLREGPERRRFLKEMHAFILGIPASTYDPDASPLTLWEGSHTIIQSAFQQRYQGIGPEDWGAEDVTQWYIETRKQCFDECQKVALPAQPGEAYVLHRHVLHGVAPWAADATAGPEGRIVVYFRPPTPDADAWLYGP